MCHTSSYCCASSYQPILVPAQSTSIHPSARTFVRIRARMRYMHALVCLTKRYLFASFVLKILIKISAVGQMGLWGCGLTSVNFGFGFSSSASIVAGTLRLYTLWRSRVHESFSECVADNSQSKMVLTDVDNDQGLTKS